MKSPTWLPEEHELYHRMYLAEQMAFAQDQPFRHPELPTQAAFADYRQWREVHKFQPKMAAFRAQNSQLYLPQTVAVATAAPARPASPSGANDPLPSG